MIGFAKSPDRISPNTWRLAASLLLTLLFAAQTLGQSQPLVLISESDSTRATVLESITFTREPFPLSSLISWSPDSRTRLIIFALNLQLQPGEGPASVTADAEDGAHRHYGLKVEQVGPVPGQEWMTGITVRLNDQLGDVGDVLVRITHNNRSSNRVRVAIGHVGGGLADDPGSAPTPAPPYVIRGRVVADGLVLAGAAVSLAGTASAVTTADGEGKYTILAPAAGDYLLSASKEFYDFSPATHTLANLSNTRSNIDFLATRQKRIVRGQVWDDSGVAFPNVQVTIIGNGVTRNTTADSTGFFIFPDVPAGFGYTVSPTNGNIFNFTAQDISQLVETTTLTFNAIRRTYSINGRVIEPNGLGVSGARVELKDTPLTSFTDESGIYSFPNISAGFAYTVVASHEDYVIEPPSFAFGPILGDRLADFRGTPHVFLRGRIADSTGRGVFGVKVNWSGTQTGTTSTDVDGSYSFLVTAFGNYSLQPSKEQDYYSYTPQNISLTGFAGSRVADFDASLNTSLAPSYVLEFDGSPKTVDYSMPLPGDYNLFWPDGLDFGHFFWEFWAMPGSTGGVPSYMISDGYGGAHAILFGFSHLGGREPGRYQLAGNVWNGVHLTSFVSDEGPAPFEWGHFAVGWDGQTIVTYFNGVPVGKTAFTGPRITPGGRGGCGRLLIGGSDHLNFTGRIAQVRGYETYNPHAQEADSVFASFIPETVFSIDGSLLSYFFKPAENIADLSLLGQYGRQHPGLVRSTSNGVLRPCPGCPLPQFVLDPTAPDFAHPNNPGQPPARVFAPADVPAGALVFDSFSRRNSTYALGGLGGLGSTEGGSSGSKTWLTNTGSAGLNPFGILNGRAVLLDNARAVAWVESSFSSPSLHDLDIQVDRRGNFNAGRNTGVSFRVADADNHFFAYSSDGPDPSQPQTLTLGYYLAGTRTNLITGVTMPVSWTTLRVITKSIGTIRVYADGTLLHSTTNAFLATNGGAGLYSNGPELGLTNRWDKFGIFSAPVP